jgi:hypothetical protein
MKLKKEGFLTRFYKWSYGLNDAVLPTNFCEFFWSLVFAIAVSPLTILSLPLQLLIPGLKENTDWSMKARICAPLAIIVCVTLLTFLGITVFNNPGTSLMIVGVLVLFGLLLALLVWKSDSLSELQKETNQVIEEKYKSVKENYCPKIEWK